MPPVRKNALPAALADPDLLESRWLARLYDWFGDRLDARVFAGLARRLEGGEFRSRTLRRVLWDHSGVIAGAFSYGAFHKPGASEPGVTIGRFASISRDVRWGLSHPTRHVALSHIFSDPAFGFTDEWPFERPTLEIGADAWIGAQVVITSACRRIGIGAIIGAGSVVTNDVPDFAIVFGSPARIARYRFSDDVQAAILASRWWERPLAQLRERRGTFTADVDEPQVLAELLKFSRPNSS